MDQGQQQQSGQSLVDIVWQQPLNSSVENDEENRRNDSSFLSELISTVQNYPSVMEITIRSFQDLNKKPVMKNIALQLQYEEK